MTAVEAYELTTKGGATDFARLIESCKSFGPYCLIGDFAVNCYVEPIYRFDAEVVVTALPRSLNATAPQMNFAFSSPRTKDTRRS